MTEPPATGLWTMGHACLETPGEALKRPCSVAASSASAEHPGAVAGTAF